MTHRSSAADERFRVAFETCEIRPEDFDHRAHLRLAYVYLTAHDVEGAHRMMRDAIRSFLGCNGIEPTKYHETLTHAWIMAVRHFMAKTADTDSADAFIEQNPRMLDSRIMLTHYSAELLFSDEARNRFVEPDRDPIPRYGE